ncbi:unnamed protein product, partial [Hapterophycus canaliculatus]
MTALVEELELPLNVHRWRKLESSDPERYDLVRKAQSLQRNVVSKTESAVRKDLLIQEKVGEFGLRKRWAKLLLFAHSSNSPSYPGVSCMIFSSVTTPFRSFFPLTDFETLRDQRHNEKLYVELKIILGRQPGPEVAEQLAVYQENLKQKVKQMRAMEAELGMYKQQVDLFKSDIEAANERMRDLRHRWVAEQR